MLSERRPVQAVGASLFTEELTLRAKEAGGLPCMRILAFADPPAWWPCLTEHGTGSEGQEAPRALMFPSNDLDLLGVKIRF